MKLSIKEIKAKGLNADSVMRCSRILNALFYNDLSDELVKKIQAWLLENINRPEVEFVLKSKFEEILPGEDEPLPCISKCETIH